MGMSTHVIGFRPPDDRWLQMKAVWDACQAARCEVPETVDAFFQGEPPDDQGVEVSIERTDAVAEWSDDYRSGFQVDVSKLPPGVSIVRFYNSW